MAAKKARKRAYIPPSSEVVNRRERSEAPRTQRTVARNSPRGGRGSGPVERVYPAPSIQRTLKRLPIYFVMIFALQYLLGTEASQNATTQQRLLYAAGSAGIVTVLFAPFMHVMDRFAYNRYLKRTGQAAPAQPSKPPRKGATDSTVVSDD